MSEFGFRFGLLITPLHPSKGLNTHNCSWQIPHEQRIPSVNKPAADQPARFNLALEFLLFVQARARAASPGPEFACKEQAGPDQVGHLASLTKEGAASPLMGSRWWRCIHATVRTRLCELGFKRWSLEGQNQLLSSALNGSFVLSSPVKWKSRK